MNQAGKDGAQMAYYALGAMYLTDEQNQMPVDQDFIKKELDLEIKEPGNGGYGNADIGLHFLILAAENGNSDAQNILEDLDTEYNKSGQNAKSEKSDDSQNTGDPSQQAQETTKSKEPQGSSSSDPASMKTPNAQTTQNASGQQVSSSSAATKTLAESIQSLDSGAIDEMIDATKKSTGTTQGQHASSGQSGTQPGVTGQQKGTSTGSSQNQQSATPTKPGNSSGKQNTENKHLEILD